MYTLYIANKNYSSWSLRPWVLMRELGIVFAEVVICFGDELQWTEFRHRFPSGKVPGLEAGGTRVWDSLSIIEYLYESHPGVWPGDARARAWARSAAAEMHSGFSDLRTRCPMNCGVRVALKGRTPELDRDITRLSDLWNEGLERFEGSFLAGPAFTAVDAFYAPVAFRIQTYGLKLTGRASGYAAMLLQRPSLAQWYAAALEETQRDEPHETDLRACGVIKEDFRRQ